MLTEDQAEEKALADFEAHKGKILHVRSITGFVGTSDEQLDLYLRRPLRVRVDDTERHAVCHWSDDEWLDPYWDVTILDSDHPELPEGGLRSCYVYGISYNVDSDEVQQSNWKLA